MQEIKRDQWHWFYIYTAQGMQVPAIVLLSLYLSACSTLPSDHLSEFGLNLSSVEYKPSQHELFFGMRFGGSQRTELVYQQPTNKPVNNNVNNPSFNPKNGTYEGIEAHKPINFSGLQAAFNKSQEKRDNYFPNIKHGHLVLKSWDEHN